MIQLKALYPIAVALTLLHFQAAFADVGDISISGVEFRDIPGSGGGISDPHSGQLILSANMTNNSTQPISYVAFLEVRDSDGVTIYLEFHKGMLNAGAPSNIASSWTPARSGEYELRVFVISDFENPEILSAIGTATTAVS